MLTKLITQFKKLSLFGTGSHRRLPMKPAASAPQPARKVIMPRNEFTDLQRSAWRQLQLDNLNRENPNTLEKLIGDIRRSPKHILFSVSAKNLRLSSLNLGGSLIAPQQAGGDTAIVPTAVAPATATATATSIAASVATSVATSIVTSTPPAPESAIPEMTPKVDLEAPALVGDSSTLDAQAFEDEIFDFLNDFTRTEAPQDFRWRTHVDLNSINKHSDTLFV